MSVPCHRLVGAQVRLVNASWTAIPHTRTHTAAVLLPRYSYGRTQQRSVLSIQQLHVSRFQHRFLFSTCTVPSSTGQLGMQPTARLPLPHTTLSTYHNWQQTNGKLPGVLQRAYQRQHNSGRSGMMWLSGAGLAMVVLHQLDSNQAHADQYAVSNGVSAPLSDAQLEKQVQKLAAEKSVQTFPFLTRLKLILKLILRLPVLGVMWLPVFGLVWFLGNNTYFLKYVVFVLENSGPGFVKLGQWAATRPDLFHEHACSILAELQTGAKPHSLKYSLRTISEMFPFVQVDVERENGTIYNYCTPHSARERELAAQSGHLRIVVDGSKNLGSGSMAQTHKGVVYCARDGSATDVAIKILHPNIRNRVESDLMLMRSVCYIIDRLPGGFKWYVPSPSQMHARHIA